MHGAREMRLYLQSSNTHLMCSGPEALPDEAVSVKTHHLSATGRPFTLKMLAQALVHNVEDIALLTSIANGARPLTGPGRLWLPTSKAGCDSPA